MEGEEGFSKSETEVKSQILFHTLSVGHVEVLCSRKHFTNMLQHKQVFYVFRNPDFLCV